MNKGSDISYIAKLTTYDQLPFSIRKSLILESDFQEKHGDLFEVLIEIKNYDVKFYRKKLYKKIIEALKQPTKKFRVKDESDQEWNLQVSDKERGAIHLFLDDKIINLGEYWALFSNKKSRIEAFYKVAQEVNLPEKSVKKWEKELNKKNVSNSKVDEILSDFRETPSRIMDSITSQLRSGSTLNSLIPTSLRYYHRLVGEYKNDRSINKHITNVLNTHIEKLISWDPKKGLDYALLLSSHSEINKRIDLERVGRENTLKTFNELLQYGDEFSKVGAIELGLQKLQDWPNLSNITSKLIEQIFEIDTNNPQSSIHALVSTIVLTDGQISTHKIYKNKAPFIRRIASIAHGCLISRCLNRVQIDVDSFSNWAFQNRLMQFYVQSLCDLRYEPRWTPDFLFADQLKAELKGRIINASHNNIEAIRGSEELSQLLLDQKTKSIKIDLLAPRNFYPGPLEGDIESDRPLPTEMEEEIKKSISGTDPQLESFIPLINSILTYNAKKKHSEAVAKLIRDAKYYLDWKNEELIFPVISGLALLSAVTRSSVLANELKILIRRLQNQNFLTITTDQLIRTILIASASETNYNKWADFLGEWFTELAFQDLSNEEAETLHSYITILCQLEPDLWLNLGKAEAAVSSII